MNINEQIIAQCILFFPSDADYQEPLRRLYNFKPESQILQTLIDARFRAVLKNESSPDILGEFLAAGGTYDEYAKASENIDDILTPSALNGAITREMNRQKVRKLKGSINDYELNRITLEDLVATIIEEQVEDKRAMSLKEIVDARCNREETSPVHVGFPILNQYLGGLQRKQITLLAARPAVGKTDFSLAIARNVLTAGGNVFIASIEMDKFQLLKRLERGAGGLDKLLHMKGHLDVIDDGNLTVPQIAASVNMGNYDLVIVDYMQIINFPHRYNNLNERMGRISNQVRMAAKNSDAAWLVLSQLNRNARDEHTAPTLSDLRDSGALEQDAHAVLFMYEPEPRDFESDSRALDIKIAKNRDGGQTLLGYRFIPRGSYWEED